VALAVACATETKPRTPAEYRIAMARSVIAAGNASAHTYNELALAFARRGRETADPDYYDQANEALAESFRLAPDNLEGQKVRIWVLLGKHEFAEALTRAKALNRQVPDDLMGHAFLTDAHIELGNYTEAEVSAQRLLDLRPGNVAGLTRGAYLRELFGDLEGALEFMTQAYDRTPPNETEERAWLLTHIAHLRRLGGEFTLAAAVVTQALELYPDYHYALAELARIRTAQDRYEDAVQLFRKRYAVAAHPENLFDLAQALHRAGKRREARELFHRFEKEALAESTGADNANRELIRYYVDYAKKPKAAWRIAEQEFSRRQDVQTLDLYAWALFATGQKEDARRQLKRALAVGARDPELLKHAQKMGIDPEKARREAPAVAGGAGF
jgi:tetratricopeptide (TPR) repeat protein